MSGESLFTVYAIKYATRDAQRGEHFYGHDPRDWDPHDTSMPMDYFVWAAVSSEHVVVIDSGFSSEVAARRGRTYLRSPIDGLNSCGIDCTQVRHVVLTHLHYDHAGNLDRFPAATFIVQDDEVAFWTGRYAGRKEFGKLTEPDDIVHLVRENFKGRVQFVDGTQSIVPGITVHRVGGHTQGLQIVRISTEQGYIVLASDSTYFYDNIEQDRPASVLSDLAQVYQAFDTVRSLADSASHIIPGHDPLVMQRFPAVTPGLKEIAVRIA